MNRLTRFALIVLLCVSLFGCKGERAQGWVLYDSEKTLYSWVRDGSLAVVVVDEKSEHPEAILAGALDIPVRTAEIPREAYEEAVATLVHLVRVQEGSAYVEASPQAMLEHLYGGALALRKSRLADTLALVTGEADPLGLFANVKQVALFDLRGKLAECPALAVYLGDYFIEVNRTMKRR